MLLLWHEHDARASQGLVANNFSHYCVVYFTILLFFLDAKSFHF